MPGPMTTDLILRGRLAKQPVTLVGTLEGGKLARISGSITADQSLQEFLKSLGAGFKEAGKTLQELTPDADIKLGSLAFGYQAKDPKFAQVAMTFAVGVNYFRFVCLKQFGKPGWHAAGLELRLDKDLFKGNVLSNLIGDISLGDLGIYYASGNLTDVAYEPGRGFEAAESLKNAIPPKTRAFNKGINWSAKVSIGQMVLIDGDKADEAKNGSNTGTGDQAGALEKPKDSTTWIDLDKTLGPLTVRRIGFALEAPKDSGKAAPQAVAKQSTKVIVKFDATLQLSVLTLSLDGLGMSYPVDKFGELASNPKSIFTNLELSLDGMGLSLGNGPIEIGGSLLRLGKDPLEFEGTLLIRTKAFSLSAFGAYKDLNGTISLMAFAVLLAELGDPTGTGGFMVTGLAFGFGVNRMLRLPTIEQVEKFPLIKAAMGEDSFAARLKLPGELRPYVTPAAGNFWIAAGIKFNSFVMVDSFLLLSVSWGAEVEIGLLGLSRMSVPPRVTPDKTIACAELALRGVIRVKEGVMQFEARLTENSFIFSRSCRLTGGFAFCIWFGGPLSGDFVISLGGYHPAFIRPTHYPLVPRVGIHWLVDTGRADTMLSITGEAYFALTPSCLMAGGKLSAVFRMPGIEAWFLAYANFLLSWQPFFYLAEMGISLGIACRIELGLFTISFRLELSVALQLWGPPFGGEATVSLWVISFVIRFGGPRSSPNALKSPEFIDTCLPKATIKSEKVTQVFSVRVTGGLLSEQKDGDRTDRIVSAHQFSLTAQSVIPCTEFEDVAAKAKCIEAPLGIRPMGTTTLQSTLSVKVLREKKTADLPNLRVSVVTGNVPDALWGKSAVSGQVPLPEKPERKTIRAMVGIRVYCESPEPANPLSRIEIATLAYQQSKKVVEWAVREEIQPYSDNTDITIFNTIWLETVRVERDSILNCLRGDGFKMNEPDLEEFSKIGDPDSGQPPFGGYFQEEPQLCALGTKPKETN